MNKNILILVASIICMSLSNNAIAEVVSSESESGYSHVFTVSDAMFRVKVIHITEANDLIVSNNSKYDIVFIDLLTSHAISIPQYNAANTACGIGSGVYLLTTKLRIFEEHVTVKCGDRVIVTGL